MKRYRYLAVLLILSLIVGGCSRTEKTKEEAEVAMKQLLTEMAKAPQSVKIDETKAIYCQDSLCIYHTVVKAKNGIGIETSERMEYVYLISQGKAYEACHEINYDSVYVSSQNFENDKKGKFYSSLSYDDALRYKAVVFIMTKGRAVGGKEYNDVELNMPLNTGLWELHQFKDQFQEETGNTYLTLSGKGFFSNSATTGSRLTAIIFSSSNNISLRLIEYDSSIVKGSGTYSLNVKDGDGDIHQFRLYNDNDGDMTFSSWEDESMPDFIEILRKGGVISCVVTEEDSYGVPSKYYFKFNTSGYLNAIAHSNDIYKSNLNKGKTFLSENKKKNGVKTLASGVQYKVIKEGNGEIPTETSLVKIHYEGRTIDGTVFDSSYKRNSPTSMRCNQAITGFADVLTNMPVGSIWEVYIPQELAYGERSFGIIKPFSTLIFKIELISIEK